MASTPTIKEINVLLTSLTPENRVNVQSLLNDLLTSVYEGLSPEEKEKFEAKRVKKPVVKKTPASIHIRNILGEDAYNSVISMYNETFCGNPLWYFRQIKIDLEEQIFSYESLLRSADEQFSFSKKLLKQKKDEYEGGIKATKRKLVIVCRLIDGLDALGIY